MKCTYELRFICLCRFINQDAIVSKSAVEQMLLMAYTAAKE